MARGSGTTNYRNDILMQVIAELRPCGALAWSNVAAIYHQRSNEAFVRDGDDVKRHWIEKLCNKMKKPTGNTGASIRDRIYRAQLIQREILLQNDARLVTGENEEEDDGDSEDDDDSDGEGEDDVGLSTASANATAVPLTQPLPVSSSVGSSTALLPASTAAVMMPPPLPRPAINKQKTKNSGSQQRGSIAKSISDAALALTVSNNRPATPQPPVHEDRRDERFLMMMQQQQQFMMMFMASMNGGGGVRMPKKKRNVSDLFDDDDDDDDNDS